jgi:hypothetical protein
VAGRWCTCFATVHVIPSTDRWRIYVAKTIMSVDCALPAAAAAAAAAVQAK